MKSGRAIKLIAKLFASWILSLAIFTSAAYAFERIVDVTHTAGEPIQLTERLGILIDPSKVLTISNVAASARATEFSLSHSVGIASVTPHDNISIDDLIGAADKAVYSAKAEGRNRVAQTHSVQHLQKL